MIFHIINFPNNRHNIFIIRQNSRFRMSRFIKLHNSFRKLYKNIWRRAMYPEFRWLILQTRNIWLINIVIFSINNSVATVRFELVSRISSSPDSSIEATALTDDNITIFYLAPSLSSTSLSYFNTVHTRFPNPAHLSQGNIVIQLAVCYLLFRMVLGKKHISFYSNIKKQNSFSFAQRSLSLHNSNLH